MTLTQPRAPGAATRTARETRSVPDEVAQFRVELVVRGTVQLSLRNVGEEAARLFVEARGRMLPSFRMGLVQFVEGVVRARGLREMLMQESVLSLKTFRNRRVALGQIFMVSRGLAMMLGALADERARQSFFDFAHFLFSFQIKFFSTGETTTGNR